MNRRDLLVSAVGAVAVTARPAAATGVPASAATRGAHITDTHLTPDRRAPEGMAALFAQFQSLATGPGNSLGFDTLPRVLNAGGRVEAEQGVRLLEAGDSLGILRLLFIALGCVLEAHQIGCGCLQLDHQLVAIDHQIEVAVAMLVGAVAVALVFVVICVCAKGRCGQQQSNCFHL